MAWRKEQMWWPNASATNGTNSGPEPGRTNASTSTSRVPERTRQHIERRRMRALELRVEAAERTRREGELQRRGERETGRKQGPPATDEAQTAPDGTDTHARDTVAFGAEEYQDWRKQNTRGAANTENQTEQATTTTMAEEGREQEPTDAQRADEEAELAGAMEEEARREAAWDEQQRTTQMLRLDMEEAEAVEMAQEAADMLQQAQEQEEMEQAAAMNERVAEQQSATTKERKAIAEADEEAKEQLQRLGTQQRDVREKAQRKAADAKHSDVQYWEDMSPQLRKAITRSAALRIGVRHRALEQAIPTILAVGGAPVGMEPDERAKIKVGPTKEVVRMARALEKAYGRFHSVIAVDASADKHEARHDGESGTTASAWGAWDGVRMLGGGLPPGTGNQLGEIAAVERVLSDKGAGERILLLCDCQGAMRAVEEHWRSGTLGWESGGDTRPGSALIEMVNRHRLRICGHKQQQDSEDAHADTHVEAMTEEEWAEVRSEGTGVEGMTEAGAALVEAILEQRGCVCILWVPAHGGGIAPNAYADAAAKSHLAETPMDIPLWTLPRTVVYAIAQEGTPHNSKQWCLLAARPLRRLIVERLTRKQLDEWQEQAPREAYSGAQTIITARDANTHILAAMSRSDKAGTDREQSATGRSQRLRSDDVGMPVSRGGGRGRKSRGAELEEDESDDPGEEDEQEDDNKKCELCGDKWADGLHALHCKRLQGAERARSEVETAIRRAAAAIPTGETRTKTDTAKEWRREAREAAPDSVAQRMDGQPPEMEQGEKREFSMVGASSGWCKSKEYMEMRLQLREDGTEPPEIGLARFCALATWNAYEAAAGAGGRATEGWALREAARSIGVTRQGANGPVLDETAMAAAESEARTGIRRIEVEYGQLHAETAPDTAGTISVSNWRGEEGEWLRERSAAAMRTGRWTIATQRRFQQGQGAHGRKIVECMAVSPHGEVYSVAPATAWPWRLCYHLQVGRLEPDMPGHLQVKVRLAEGDEGQLEATVRAEIIGYTGKKLHVAGEGWVRTTIAPTENGDSGVRMLFGVHGWPCTTPRHSTIGGAFETAIQAVGRQTTALETAEREQQWRAVRTILAGVVPALDIAERRWEKERREHEAVAAQERAEEEERQQDAPPENEMSTAETAAYETLGTEPGAKMAQVRSAFRKQALRTHPDRPGGDAMAFRRVEEAMRTITERAQEKGPTNGNTPTLHQIRPRVWELIVASLTTGSESLFRAIGAHQRATRRQKELEAASEGTTITEQRERRRTGRREAHILEKEAAQETARAAMQAEESRVRQARQSRGAAEVEALTSLEGQRAIQAFVMDPEYIRKNYEVWLPDGMWGRKHGKTGGHTPFRIVEYDIRYNESATEGATMWCKLEASSATLICKLEVNETVLGGERSWEEKRCFWAPVHDEEGGEEEGPGEEIEALEAAAEKNIATRARKLMREAAAARRAAEAARERGRGEPMGDGGGTTRTRTHRTTGDARMGRIAQLELTNSWRSTTTRTATQTPQATPTQTNAEMRHAAQRTIFAARAAAAAAGETAMWSIRQQTAATAMEWADAEARMLTAARTNANGSEGTTGGERTTADTAEVAARAMEGQLPSSSAEARRGRRWLMEKVVHEIRTADKQKANGDTLPLWTRATGIEPRGDSTRERLIANQYVIAARAAQQGQQESRREAPTTTGVRPGEEELSRTEGEDGKDATTADEEMTQTPMADTEMPQAATTDEEMPQAPDEEGPTWTRIQQMQTSKNRLQELVSGQRPAGLRTGLSSEGENKPSGPRARWTHIRFVQATRDNEEEVVPTPPRAEGGRTQTTTTQASQPPTAPLQPRLTQPLPTTSTATATAPPQPPSSPRPQPPPPPPRTTLMTPPARPQPPTPGMPPPLPPRPTRSQLSPPLRRRRGVIAIGRLRRGDTADFMSGDGTGRLFVRWRDGEIQARIDRETWLGNPLTMADTWNEEERRKVCEGCVLWRREGGDLRHIAGREGMRLARPPDRRWTETQQAHTEHWAAMAELTALATWAHSIRLMCWCRHGPAGEWQAHNRCHGDDIAADIQNAIDIAAAHLQVQLPLPPQPPRRQTCSQYPPPPPHPHTLPRQPPPPQSTRRPANSRHPPPAPPATATHAAVTAENGSSSQRRQQTRCRRQR